MVKGVKCERRKRSRAIPDTGFATYRQVFTCSRSSFERVRSTCTGVGTSQAGNRVRPGEGCDCRSTTALGDRQENGGWKKLNHERPERACR